MKRHEGDEGLRGFWRRPATLLAFGKALRGRREGLGMTLDVLAQATGISKPYLSNIETARSPGPPSEEKLRKLARSLEIPVEELLAGADWLRAPMSIRKALAAAVPEERGGVEGGGGLEVEDGAYPPTVVGGLVGEAEEVGEASAGGEDMRPRRADGTVDLDALMQWRRRRRDDVPGDFMKPGETEGKAAEGAAIPVRSIPLINRVAAGTAGEFGDLSYPVGVADAYVPAPDLPEVPVASAFAVRVIGDSMMPEYREGEILIVGPGEAKDGDDCVVRLGELTNFATTFKRVYFVEEGVRLVPLNPAHAERRVGLEEVTGIYPVIYRLMPAGKGRGEVAEVKKGFTSTEITIEND